MVHRQLLGSEFVTKTILTLRHKQICVIVMFVADTARGCSSMAEPLPSKQIVRVRFSSSARSSDSCSGRIRALFVSTVVSVVKDRSDEERSLHGSRRIASRGIR